MIVIMKLGHQPEQRDAVIHRITELGLSAQPIYGENRTVIAVLGQVMPELRDEFATIDGVDEVLRVSKPYKLSNREVHVDDTVIDVGYGVRVGGGRPVFLAGPCSIESLDQLHAAGVGVKAAGAHILRGGAFKPRTSPYSFQGLGVPGLKMLKQVGDELGMPTITELLSVRDVEAVAEHASILQIGARNMSNFVLLAEAGKTGKPVMLKRGPASTIEEWLLAADYILNQGNPNVMLCERGHPHVRDGDAQHPRPERGRARQAAEPPPGHRRSLARDGEVVPRAADVDGLDRGRRRRADHRGAPEPGSRARPTAPSR